MEEKLWNVSSSPHVRDHSSTQSIMRDVVIALLPATIIGIKCSISNFNLLCILYVGRIHLAEIDETEGNNK